MGSLLNSNSNAVRKRIENHNFEDEEGEEYEGSRFGGFGDYMRRKKIKLQNLDAQIRSTSADNPPIFRGVVAHVNGYTQPSLQDLHRLIVSHGGGFLQYLDGKTVATHIIASALTPKKRDEFRRYRIVKPAWVVESVKAGRLLPWDDFRVVDEGYSQKVIKFDNGRISSQANPQRFGYRDQSRASWYASQLRDSDVVTPQDIGSHRPPTPAESSATTDQILSDEIQSDYGELPSFTLEKKGKDSCESQENELPDDGPKETHLKATESLNHEEPKLSPGPAPNALSSHLPLVREPAPPKPEMTSEEYNAQLLSDPRMRNSSVVNPEFLQQYYRESRLHHLSTWKAELKAQLQTAAKEKTQSQKARPKPPPGTRRYILHVDFDSFFAAVSIRKHPELEGKPVAIAHGTGSGSEIASCNYPARAFGIKNGMWMKGALQMCPELKVLPYDFPAYEEASRKFYSAVLAVDGVVQSVSIDEALVDITSQCLEAGGSDGRGISEGSLYREQAKADEIAERLRVSVKEKTGCAVSVGIGGNILLAKLALRKAKPAGQFQLKPDAVLEFIGNLTVLDLPGVGYSLGAKLEELGVKFVKDMRDLSREKLVSSLGPKTGAKMWDYARGIDKTVVGNEVIRRSVSAEVNWGIRFVNNVQAEDFVRSLCDELHRRLVENLVRGRQLTLKVMRRSMDAPLEPVKHLGHGKCDVFNKSVMLGVATNAKDVLGKEAVSMLKSFGFSPGDLRGLGVQMTKLEPLKSGPAESSQRQLNFDTSPARKRIEQNTDPDDVDSPSKGDNNGMAVSDTVRLAPSLNDSSQKPLNLTGMQFILPTQADPQVVAELPNDIRSKLVSQAKVRRQDARSESPTPAPTRRPQPPATAELLPPQSQLDPETLAALPEDVRAEVLAYYNPPPSKSLSSQPQSTGSLRLKKPTTPTKKRRGRPSTKALGNMKLTQSNFVRPPRPVTPATDASDEASSRQPSPSSLEPPEKIPEDILAALPEDIRREVLEEQRRAHLQRSRMVAPPPKPSAPAPPQRLALPPLPERPTFTSKKLSNVSDLRRAVDAWYSSFATDGPYADDVAALCKYLKRVVVEEKDLDKAVSVVNWMAWLIDNGPSFTEDLYGCSQDNMPWDHALRCLQACVADALQERGLPPVEFD